MPKGRKQTPTALKLLKGVQDKDPSRIKKNEAPADSTLPAMPRGLDPVARAEWGELVGWMTKMGICSKSYERSMRLYCESYSMYRKATSKVQKMGIAIEKIDTHGNTQFARNPWTAEQHKYLDQCYRFLTEFGLTPSAKTKIVSDKLPADDKSRFFGGA